MYELFFLANAFFFFFLIAIYVGVYVFKKKALGKAAVHRKEGSTLSKIFMRKFAKQNRFYKLNVIRDETLHINFDTPFILFILICEKTKQNKSYKHRGKRKNKCEEDYVIN